MLLPIELGTKFHKQSMEKKEFKFHMIIEKYSIEETRREITHQSKNIICCFPDQNDDLST